MSETFDCAVVGGGPAGLMCALTAVGRGLKTALIDKNNPSLPRKLLISGKGRCNVTNDCDDDFFFSHIISGERFLRSCYASFGPQEIMSWFRERGIPLKTERGGRVFPVSDKAADIAEALQKEAIDSGVKLVKGDVCGIICSDGKAAGVKLSDGGIIRSDAVVLATGGLSYPRTGSDGSGYSIAKEAGHTVTELFGSLVPVECRDDCAAVQGLSLRNVSLRWPAEGKSRFKEQGEMLFTHFGISGPLVLTLSTVLRNADINGTQVSIDLKPALDSEVLDKRILRDFSTRMNKDIRNSLDELLPKSLIPVIIERSGIDPETKVNSVTAAQRRSLVSAIKDLRLTLTRLRPVSEAIVTAGGISLKEINPKTMESKILPGLYFAGEIMDLDGTTGGFNITIALSTGYAAGRYVLSEGKK